MSIPEGILSRAGRILYRELPEEYRYRDTVPPDDLADLEAYLHGFGDLLDLIRGTTEQAYNDAFAEPVDSERPIQPWLIPYLAELVGAELMAPDPAHRAPSNTADRSDFVQRWFREADGTCALRLATYGEPGYSGRLHLGAYPAE